MYVCMYVCTYVIKCLCVCVCECECVCVSAAVGKATLNAVESELQLTFPSVQVHSKVAQLRDFYCLSIQP